MLVAAAAPARAQVDGDGGGDDPGDGSWDGGDPGDDPGDDPGGWEDPGGAAPVSWSAPVPATSTESNGGLVCSGGWRYPLKEVRQEIGPARFARQRDLQRDVVVAGAAFAYCKTAEANGFADVWAGAVGPCAGLLKLAEKIDYIASNLFRTDDAETAACLTTTAQSGGSCEGVRGQLTNLRNYDQIIVDRAELVLAYEVCTSPERGSNSALRNACTALEGTVAAEVAPGGNAIPGMFALAAPLPAKVARAVADVAEVTDGRYQSLTPENFVGVRRTVCQFPGADATGGMTTAKILERGSFVAKDATPYAAKDGAVKWGMCNELALADVNASSCRAASIYIDERGELHLNQPLTTRAQRADATLCVDVSDFHPDQPLMVTIGLDATGSVPERVWPGETMHIGRLIDEPVTREDVLSLRVYGKAHGISLAEVLRINGVTDPVADRDEACRMARSWVPVVDHEVPIGTPSEQAVIPLTYGRGRVGETQRIDEGDYVVLWVKDIEPAGSVVVEYAKGQYVGYQPPPLLGEPGSAATIDPNAGAAGDEFGDGGDVESGGVVPAAPRPPTGGPGTSLAMRAASVEQPLLPRRARYPGSRVLRLGTPSGNHEFPLRVCTTTGAVNIKGTTGGCTGARVIVDEKLFVNGSYHFGLRMFFGYTGFPTPAYTARPLGGGAYEVVQTSATTSEYDLAVLLATYPFGRDPRRFSYDPLSADYWKSAAVLAGFGVRNITRPWDDFYLGASLPIGNGVSLTGLAHVGRRDVALDVHAGDTFTSADPAPDVTSVYPTSEAIVVGASVGLSFDYDLFERAFISIWDRLAGRSQFQAAGRATRRAH
ncbi:MAG: hypothetical protein H6708_10440 [Kofleriaceae bacterium]|nr:hypothetical protein [Kofleriaceae bacterium]